jgi:hypothetical protein
MTTCFRLTMKHCNYGRLIASRPAYRTLTDATALSASALDQLFHPYGESAEHPLQTVAKEKTVR